MRADNVRCKKNQRTKVEKMPTKIVRQTNKMYVMKSPGCENLGEAVSSLLPYVYTIADVSQMLACGTTQR
jgi:hypothetical protein